MIHDFRRLIGFIQRNGGLDALVEFQGISLSVLDDLLGQITRANGIIQREVVEFARSKPGRCRSLAPAPA